MDLGAVSSDSQIREGLARKRQHLWSLMSLDENREQRDELAMRVRQVTIRLNGNHNDITDKRTARHVEGGEYEHKRVDAARLLIELELHEYFLDSCGRRVRGR